MLSVYLFFKQSNIQNENQSGDYQKKRRNVVFLLVAE